MDDKEPTEEKGEKPEPERRRLAAIMFTDIVGYTALTQENERMALRQLDEHRNLLRSIFRKQDGREINAMGDAFLVEFESSLQAVECAIMIQSALHGQNQTPPPGRRTRVRIGIHIGDVVYRGHDVYGDAVNIASRIEKVVTGEGIYISQNVADDVRRKIDRPLLRLGRYALKNVDLPMEVYKVVMPWDADAPEPPNTTERRRIAVLPLVNISPEPKDEYFADGMTDELISTLSNIGNLGVIARTSVMRFKGVGKGIGEIARELNAESLLEGSIRKAENKLRVTVQLVDGKSEEEVWSRTFERELEDVFAIQTEIAREVAGVMKIQLGRMETRRMESRPTQSVDAHSLYLKGRYHWNKRTEEGLRTAAEDFKQAIAEDPNYALAYVGLADCYRVLASRSLISPAEAYPKAKSLAMKALELDEMLAEGHAALANTLDNEWDWKGAEREYRRAIELNPSYASAYQWYALHLGHLGEIDRAIEVAIKAERLDPLSPAISATVFEEYYFAREYDLAIEQCKKVLSIDPDFPLTHFSLGLAYIQKSKLDEADEELQRAVTLSGGVPEFRAHLGYLCGISGKEKRAREILREMKEASASSHISPATLALVHLGLGEIDEAFSSLEKAYLQKATDLTHLKADPIYDKVRADKRFSALLTRIGLEA